MNGCEWEKIRRNNPEVKQYLKYRFYPENYKKLGNALSRKKMITALSNGSIFGLAMVDIKTPEYLKEYFSIMQPIVLNRIVKREDLGELMKKYCIENKQMSRPRKVLGQAFSAKNILLTTPLLKWYINKGMIVTKIHWIRQYKKSRVFQPLVDKAIEYRKLADENPDMSLQGTSWKLGKKKTHTHPLLHCIDTHYFLAGNSFYGKTLESGQNYHDIKVGNENYLKKAIRSSKFSAAEPVTDTLYEIQFTRKVYKEEKPLIIGFFILQYSKLRVGKLFAIRE